MSLDLGHVRYDHYRASAHALFVAIRSGRVKCLRSILAHYEFPLSLRSQKAIDLDLIFYSNTGAAMTHDLSLLLESNFIVVKTPDGGPLRSLRELSEFKSVDLDQLAIEATSVWKDIVKVFGFGVETLIKLNKANVEVIEPVFRAVRPRVPVDVFVAMPFDKSFDQVFRDGIWSAAYEAKLNVVRGDDISASGNANVIVNEIWGMMKASKVMVADCTGRNANVFYELGMAHTLGVRTIIITQNKADIPFDIQHMRYILYERSQPGIAALKLRLQEAMADRG